MGKYDPAPTVAAGLLRSARDIAGLTQQELAGLAGITQQAVSAYETGRKEPTMPTLTRILHAAGLEMRIRLSPIDDHDAALHAFMESLPAEKRVEVEADLRERADAARLRRTRGK